MNLQRNLGHIHRSVCTCCVKQLLRNLHRILCKPILNIALTTQRSTNFLTSSCRNLPISKVWRRSNLLLSGTTTQDTGTTGGNETDLLTWRCVTSSSSWMTNVRMLNRIHRHTTNLRPAVAFHSVLVE